MLETTKAKLAALYAGGKHLGTDGQLHEIDPIVRVSDAQGEIIAKLHRSLRPTLSIEIGLAYGFSTLFILDAMKEASYGNHVALDPAEESLFHGIGLQAVKDASLSERFEWMQRYSADALPALLSEGKRAQFIYIDGAHLFDYALVDFFLSDQILDIGGMILMDDMWMASIQRVVSFVSKNMSWYERIDVSYDNLAVFRKKGQDTRPWNHFVNF